jgi:hypothetical protein
VWTQAWVRSPELPDDEDLSEHLTGEDYCDLTLEHIIRTSEIVGRFEFRKRS